MAYQSSTLNAALNAGISHLTTGRANGASLTLGGDAGLQADSARWDAMTPRGVLASTPGTAPQDGAWQQIEREQGSYRPGSMPQLEDELAGGHGSPAAMPGVA
ncbi:MAG TPA: hypothetical protein VFO01_11500 [Trebonia sp.]|nr:hypothetical protein [Trebonia sp.]